MFSVLYRDQIGGESLQGGFTHVDKIFEKGKKMEIRATWPDGSSVTFGETLCASPDDVPREVIVMNENGKTVARWGL